MNFVTIFESQKMSFGQHQSTTYENSHKMTTSEVMLWCQPNDNLVKIFNSVKVKECAKSSFGPDQVLETDHNNKRQVLAPRRFTETKWNILEKLVISPQQNAIGAKQGHQQ